MAADESPVSPNDGKKSPRRPRYAGRYPRRFSEKYKEHASEQFPEILDDVRRRGMTPAGMHVPVMAKEVIDALRLFPGAVVADCTLGHGGHSRLILERIGPSGRLLAIDHDGKELERTRARFAETHTNVEFCRSSYAGIGKAMAVAGIAGFNAVLADLGCSSMQLDDPKRGFSLRESGPLDMRMDDREKKTAGDLLADLDERTLARAFTELSDEPDAAAVARRIVLSRADRPLKTTDDLKSLVLEVKGLSPHRWREELQKGPRAAHPAARIFQALRILVNDEFGALEEFLRNLPWCMAPMGRVCILTFHSGEEKRVAESFASGKAAGFWTDASEHPQRPTAEEVRDNPRARSARLFCAERAVEI